MFACIYDRSVPETQTVSAVEGKNSLVDLAFIFSPLVEQTAIETVVMDISGQDLLFWSPSTDKCQLEMDSTRNVANEIARRAKHLNLRVNVAVAANPDAAIHAARCFPGVTVMAEGGELSKLTSLSIKKIDHSLVGIDDKRAEEIQDTFALWGVRTFADLAKLPLAGVAERLGQDGVWLQKLAQGKTDRNLKLVRPPIGFEQSLELEHPISEIEPLSFILSRLLNQLCANLHEYALATNELCLQLITEPRVGARESNAAPENRDNELHERTITLPVPMRNSKTFLRLLLFELEREPPPAPIVAVSIRATPVKPRTAQTGLFIPVSPEPEKLEITLARLAKLVGVENVGSPEMLDTYRPDAFRMKRFKVPILRRRKHSNPRSAIRNPQCVMGFRIFRPSWRAEVQIRQGKPTRINARSERTAGRVRGEIVCAAGPWRSSGEWWVTGVWARDEWDVAVINPNSRDSETLCRIFRDLTNDQWFVTGIYD